MNGDRQSYVLVVPIVFVEHVMEFEAIIKDPCQSQLFIDGREIKNLVAFTISHSVNEKARLHATINLYKPEGHIVRGGADLTVEVRVFPGYRLIERLLPDGVKEYTCERVEDV